MNTKPVKYLEGNLVYLRPYEGGADTDALYRACHVASISALTGNSTPVSRRQVEEHVQRISSDDDTRVDFIIARQADDAILGEIVLNGISNGNSNLRLALFEEANTGKGYGSEAIRLILGYGFGMRGLHRISLSVYEHNHRALHVYGKLGFRREGVLRETLLLDHVYRNEVVMSILEHEYRAMYRNDVR